MRECIRAEIMLCVVVLLLTGSLSLAQQDPLPLPATEETAVLYKRFVSIYNSEDLIIHPHNPLKMYWAISDVGVLRSEDGGASWHPVNFGLPNLSAKTLGIDPADPDYLLVGFKGETHSQNSRPYRSINGGERWEPTVICELQQDGSNLNNLRQWADSELIAFNPIDPSRLYYLITSRVFGCGGIYRSCDAGASYDRNPRCIADPYDPPSLRPDCYEVEPEPINSLMANDATFLQFDPDTSAVIAGTGGHPENTAVMTSYDQGQLWIHEDVVDTSGSFLPPDDQGIASLQVKDLVLSPSNPAIRYAALAGVRCTDDKAYPQHPVYDCSNPDTTLDQPPVVVRWFEELSGNTDCEGTNDCDGDDSADRIWKPIFDARSEQDTNGTYRLMVHATDPNRVFVITRGDPHLVLMLTPVNPGDPSQVPWNGTRIFEIHDRLLQKLVQDPSNPDSFYVLARSETEANENVPIQSIYHFSSTDGWQTWEHVELASLNALFHIYDLVETNGSDGHQIIAATTTGIYRSKDEGGAEWWGGGSEQGVDLAVSPSDPDRVFAKIALSTAIGEGGFDSLYRMDRVRYRRDVMCTNVFHELEVDPDDVTQLYAATGAGIWLHPNARVPRAPDTVESVSHEWIRLAAEAQGLDDEYIWCLSFDPNDPDHNNMLAGTRDQGIFESDDRGYTWGPSSIGAPVNDIRDIEFLELQGTHRGYAASSLGVFVREAPGDSWHASFLGDRIQSVSPAATGEQRVYAAGEQGLYRTRSAGSSWEILPVTPEPPFSTVLETLSRSGIHYLWVPDFRKGLYRISSTMSSRPWTDTQSVVLTWIENHPEAFTGYWLHYGADPDALDGQGANEGDSPILLGAVTSATLSGLDFRSESIYVALQGIGDGGRSGPVGLPLQINFGYTFSPEIVLSLPPPCTPAIRLAWEPIPEALGYKIYRSSIGPESPFEEIAIIDDPSQSIYDDANVTVNETYWYFTTTLFPEGETSGGNIEFETVIFEDANGDGYGEACDCDSNNPDIYPGAPELNDGMDNQCPGDSGYGMVDELGNDTGFHNPSDKNAYSWSAQTGATIYQVARSSLPDFSSDCLVETTTDTNWIDPETPPVNGVFYYLVRSLSPYTGSWGRDSQDNERLLSCAVEFECEDGDDNDADGFTDCEDEDCWDAPPCHIAVFTFEDTDGDDIVSTALYDFFELARVNAADYILFEEVSDGEGWAWCAERADFYRDNYLAYAVDGGSAHSQGIAKWYRNPNTGGSWLGPDTTYYWNLYSENCFGIYSWCSEDHWDEWGLTIIPDRDDAYEAYVRWDANACGQGQTCQLTIRIGPSRAHACGF